MKWCYWRPVRVWQRNCDVFLRLWRAEVPGFLVEPIMVLFAMGLGLGAYVGEVGGQRYVEFITPGLIAAYAMYSATFECTYGTFVRMEYQKTFDAILATPLSIDDVVVGEILWGAARSFMTGVAILMIAAAFRLVVSPWAVALLPLIFLEGIMFSCIAMLFTSLSPTMYSFNYFMALFITPMFFFSGVFFPLTSFPEIVQRLSWIAPLTSVVSLSRALIQGEFYLGLLWPFCLIILVIAIFFPVALIMMRRRLIV